MTALNSPHRWRQKLISLRDHLAFLKGTHGKILPAWPGHTLQKTSTHSHTHTLKKTATCTQMSAGDYIYNNAPINLSTLLSIFSGFAHTTQRVCAG